MQDNTMKKLDNENDTEKFLSFYSNNVEYAIDIKYITDIIKVLPITFLPELPRYIKGIINLRGKVVPIVDIRLRFGTEEIPYTDATCIIVMEYENINVGIVVDSVAEVSDLKISEIMAPPKSNNSEHNRFVSGISNQNDKVKLIVNCMQIFEVE